MATKQMKVRMLLTELDGGGYHLFLSIKVNGKRARFLIDTGASKSVIDKGFYEKYLANKKALKTIKRETAGLHSSVPESHFGTIKELEIGKLKVKNYAVAAVDLSHVNATYAKLKKPKIQGILGSDLMLKHKMILDYGTGTLYIP